MIREGDRGYRVGFKFHGRDFQAWADFELDVEGLTVLIGPSNEGKTSIARAIKGLVRNELGQHFVRTHGEKLDITLEIDGTTVNATRTKKGSTVYTVNRPEFETPKEFAKLGGAIPDEVQALGMGDFSIADTTLDPVFASQADARQFMLQETPMVLNAILGKFSSTERLEAGKREANTQIAEKNAEAKTIAKQIQEAEALKGTLVGLVDRANEITAAINVLTPEIQRREEEIPELDLLATRQRQYEQLLGVIAQLPVLDTRPLEKRLLVVGHVGDLVASQDRLQYLRRIVKRLAIPNVDLVIRQAEIVEQTEILGSSLHAFTLNRRWSAKTEEVIAVWTGIVAAYNLRKAIASTLEVLAADAAGEAKARAARLGEMHEGLSATYDASSTLYARLEALRVAQDRILRLSDLSTQVETLDTQLTEAHRQQEAVEQQLEAAREEERKANALHCPKCGFEIDSTTGEAHEHSRHDTSRTSAETQASPRNGQGTRHPA